MNMLHNSIVRFLQFAIEKEKLIILLNFSPLSFIADTFLFFITRYEFIVKISLYPMEFRRTMLF